MKKSLTVSYGFYTSKGRKTVNQDFTQTCIPKKQMLITKGIVCAIADGISSSEVSGEASESAVKGFIEDYYSTPESWSVERSAQRVLMATNAWLYSQSQRSQYRFDKDKGYVSTFSGLILKSHTAHVIHAGDARVYKMRDGSIEQLTHDHRVWVSKEKSHLARAVGASYTLKADYMTSPLNVGDVFVLATDGVYEYLPMQDMLSELDSDTDLNSLAREWVDRALEAGSDDNLTVHFVRVDDLPDEASNSLVQDIKNLPLPPQLDVRMNFDGYELVKRLHQNSRSHIFLARDLAREQQVVLKIPSFTERDNDDYVERLLMEEWVAKRINNPHVLKHINNLPQRNYLYSVMEYVEGITLEQWMRDNPKPSLESVRVIVEQIAKGLQAFHRNEMLHQDLRPQNVMIDEQGVVKIIDFGSTHISGVFETHSVLNKQTILGTALYSAPEYFLGEQGTRRSDIFSLAVITYQMLSGHFPYGTAVAKSVSRSAQNKLKYQSVLNNHSEIPLWIDGCLKKALSINPDRRYSELSEFMYDLRHPNTNLAPNRFIPLMERNPVRFWQFLAGGLLVSQLATLVYFLL